MRRSRPALCAPSGRARNSNSETAHSTESPTPVETPSGHTRPHPADTRFARAIEAGRRQKERETMIGICGDHCLYCPRYVATQNGGAKALEEVKELWVRLGLRDPAFPPPDMVCLGCRPENKCAYSDIRACVQRKRIENCGLCRAYPCGLLNAVFEKSEKLRSHAARVCTPEEMDALRKAFFSKRQNLDRMRFGKNEDQGKQKNCRQGG